MRDSYAHQIHSERNLLAQQVSRFFFTVYIPCKPDSSLFYVESWGPVSVYFVSQTQLHLLLLSPCAVGVSQIQPPSSAESLCCVECESDSVIL